MEDNKQNIFDWISEQLELNKKQNVYKGPIENQMQDYNIKCIEIIAEAIKMFPNWTFIQILLNYGLLDANIHQQSNSTLGSLRTRKKQWESFQKEDKQTIIERWNKLGLCDGLEGVNIDENISDLYEYKE